MVLLRCIDRFTGSETLGNVSIADSTSSGFVGEVFSLPTTVTEDTTRQSSISMGFDTCNLELSFGCDHTILPVPNTGFISVSDGAGSHGDQESKITEEAYGKIKELELLEKGLLDLKTILRNDEITLSKTNLPNGLSQGGLFQLTGNFLME